MNDLIEFFMDPLRLTLVGAGVGVLLAIVLFSRKSSKRQEFVYEPNSSKEFSFGSQKDDPNAGEILVDEEVVVVPRKKTESEFGEIEAPRTNAYNVKEEPKRFSPSTKTSSLSSKETRINEFRAFQGASDGEQMACDVFNDELISTRDTSTETAAANIKTNTFKPAETHSKTEQKPTEFEAAKVSPSNSRSEYQPKPEPEIKTDKKSRSAKSASEQFVVLHVIAAEGKPFNGLEILESTKTLGLAFGKHSIFHYPMSAAPAGDSKFCLVNMSPEGNFETNKISSLETNGVSLIMRLPIRGADSLTVFSNMLGVAQALARKLGGEIIDQTRVPLTADIIDSIRTDIRHFDESQKALSNNKEAIPEV